jgi:hypothetical protein
LRRAPRTRRPPTIACGGSWLTFRCGSGGAAWSCVLTGTPGTAGTIAQAIDESTLTQQEGTLAGDNTLLVLFADDARLEGWLERFQAIQAQSTAEVSP